MLGLLLTQAIPGLVVPFPAWGSGEACPQHRLVSAERFFWGKRGHEKHNGEAVCQSGVPISAAGKGAR